MERKPVQFTIRAIAVSTFWMGLCLAAFGFARCGILPSVFFVLAVISLCGAVYALFRDPQARGTPPNVKAFAAAIVVWHLAILLLTLVYPNTIGVLMRASYEVLFGNIQASYVAFERAMAFVFYFTVTFPATLVAVWLFNTLSRRFWSWGQVAWTISAWEFLAVLVLVSSYEIGFSYALNQVGWAIFGPPDDLYGFRNVLLPRVISWFIEMTPVAWTSLWLCSRLGEEKCNIIVSGEAKRDRSEC